MTAAFYYICTNTIQTRIEFHAHCFFASAVNFRPDTPSTDQAIFIGSCFPVVTRWRYMYWKLVLVCKDILNKHIKINHKFQ